MFELVEEIQIGKKKNGIYIYFFTSNLRPKEKKKSHSKIS